MRFAREVRWVPKRSDVRTHPKLLPFQREGVRRGRAPLRFKQSRALNAAAQAARQRRAGSVAGQRRAQIPAYASVARRHRSWKWRAEWAAATRPDGRSKPLDRNGEHISHAALGLDDARGVRVAFELAPEAKNLHVDATIENILMHPGGLQQMLAAERALR